MRRQRPSQAGNYLAQRWNYHRSRVGHVFFFFGSFRPSQSLTNFLFITFFCFLPFFAVGSHLDSRFHRVGSGSLQIDAVTEADVGDYQCRAENTEDSVDVTAQLEVQVPPRYVTRPRSTISHEKDDAELECQLYGRPEPTVQWTKNGELIIESEYFQVIPLLRCHKPKSNVFFNFNSTDYQRK